MINNSHQLPVQRCISGEDVHNLSDEELLAIIIGTGSSGLDVMTLASFLIRDHSNLHGIAASGLRELSMARGIGLKKAVRIKAALEAGKRMKREYKKTLQLHSPVSVYSELRYDLQGLEQEEFMILVLDNRNTVLKKRTVSRGTVSETLVHPREVFRDAIRENGTRVIAAHNHPSGDPEPSHEDIDITVRLKKAGEIIGIQLVDHLIITDHGYLSMKEEGYL